MRTVIDLNGHTFAISAANVGEVDGFPFEKSDRYSPHYKYRVTVVVNAGKRFSFDFYTSTHDFNNGIDQLDAKGLIGTFYNFLMDASSGAMGFDEFCAEFGYDTDSRNAERIWKACHKSFGKFAALDVGELGQLMETLAEKYPEAV